MKKIHSKSQLKEKIYVLELQQHEEFVNLKSQFQTTYESLKPINFIKSTLQEVSSSTVIKNNLLNNTIGLATGYLSKRVLVGASHNPIKRLLGTILEFAIANIVTKKAESIQQNQTS